MKTANGHQDTHVARRSQQVIDAEMASGTIREATADGTIRLMPAYARYLPETGFS